MSRIRPVNPTTADSKTKTLLDSIRKKMGRVPNILATMAVSPAVAEAYLSASSALAAGSLSPPLRELIALTVAEANGCPYCLAAHTTIGEIVGLTAQQMQQARLGRSTDAKTDVALRLARKLVDGRGWITDVDAANVRQAGYSDGELAEIVANVALNLFTNYFNHVARTEVDFPAAPPLKGEPCRATS